MKNQPKWTVLVKKCHCINTNNLSYSWMASAALRLQRESTCGTYMLAFQYASTTITSLSALLLYVPNSSPVVIRLLPAVHWPDFTLQQISLIVYITLWRAWDEFNKRCWIAAIRKAHKIILILDSWPDGDEGFQWGCASGALELWQFHYSTLDHVPCYGVLGNLLHILDIGNMLPFSSQIFIEKSITSSINPSHHIQQLLFS